MASYPAALYVGTAVSGTQTVDVIDHALRHTNDQNEIVAIETAIGTNSGTNILKNFVSGNFPARINSSNVLQQRVSGTIDNAILGTPSISAGTISNMQLIGTSQITGGTISNAALIGTSQITGGSVSNAVIGTPTLIGATNNYVYSTVVGTTGTAQAFAALDATNLTGTITTSNSNKVRVTFQTSITNNGANSPLNVFQIVRNPAGTPGTVSQLTFQTLNSGSAVFPTIGVVTLTGIDTPSTGSNIYQVRYKTSQGTLTLLGQPDTTTFTVEEIRAG